MKKFLSWIIIPVLILFASVVVSIYWEKLSEIVQENSFRFRFIFIALSLLLCIVYLPFALLIRYHYFREEAIKKHKSMLDKLGWDITRLFSWLFSVDGLLLVLVGTIITFIIVIICNFNNLKDENRLELTALTLSISLAALIPSLISRIVAKSHLDEIIENKLETELNNFKTSLYGIRRDKGHSCRMSAELLYQNAEEKKNVANAIWSIGWASDAITQYLLIMDDYKNAKERISECLISIYKSFIIAKEKSNTEIRYRDLTSILTMFALLRYFSLVKDMEIYAKKEYEKELEKKYNSVNDDEKRKKAINNETEKTIVPVEDIVKHFYKLYKEKVYGDACRITGMSNEFNLAIESEAENIIKSLDGRE